MQKQYCHAGEIMKHNPTGDIRLVLKATRETVDPRRYNVPTGSDVSVIIPTDNQQGISPRDVIVYKDAKHHPSGKSLMQIMS